MQKRSRHQRDDDDDEFENVVDGYRDALRQIRVDMCDQMSSTEFTTAIETARTGYAVQYIMGFLSEDEHANPESDKVILRSFYYMNSKGVYSRVDPLTNLISFVDEESSRFDQLIINGQLPEEAARNCSQYGAILLARYMIDNRSLIKDDKEVHTPYFFVSQRINLHDATEKAIEVIEKELYKKYLREERVFTLPVIEEEARSLVISSRIKTLFDLNKHINYLKNELKKNVEKK